MRRNPRFLFLSLRLRADKIKDMTKEHKRTGLIKAIITHSDNLGKFSLVALGLVSLLCATCNVLVPILQKNLLERLDMDVEPLLWSYAGVGIGACVFLLLENFINIHIMARMRRELEYAMEESLAIREQPLLLEKGVGVFAGEISGDAEQLSRVLAAGWFSLLFNLVGAIVSIIISATWKYYFLIIVLVAYVLILLTIFFSARASVNYFRKEKEITYALNAKIREMVDAHHAIMSYGSYVDYRNTFKKELELRAKYSCAAEQASSTADAIIRFIRVGSLILFFLFAVLELRAIPSPEKRMDEFPTILALVSYFETIFVPVATLNTTYNYASRFRAFYDPYEDITTHDRIGEIPFDLNLSIHNTSHIRDGMVILSTLSMDVDRIYGVTGLEGEAKSVFISFLKGESYPVKGHIALGGARIYEIEKYLRLSLLMFNSLPNEVFGNGLEFNVTLGKQLVSDKEYDALYKDFAKRLRLFLEKTKEGTIFTDRKLRDLRDEMMGNLFGIDHRLYRQKQLQDTFIAQVENIEDVNGFIASVGRSLFAKKYAKKSRYDAIIAGLELADLELRPFGPSGKYLTRADKALVLLARFLLPDVDAPFVLIDPLEHVPADQVKRCVRFIKKAIDGRKGFLFTQDIELFRSLTDEVLLFENGYLAEHASHSRLIKKSKAYAKLCKDSGLLKE